MSNCRTCKWFKVNNESKGFVSIYDGDGQCHRHSPIQKSRPGSTTVNQVDGWPDVELDDGCGDWVYKG